LYYRHYNENKKYFWLNVCRVAIELFYRPILFLYNWIWSLGMSLYYLPSWLPVKGLCVFLTWWWSQNWFDSTFGFFSDGYDGEKEIDGTRNTNTTTFCGLTSCLGIRVNPRSIFANFFVFLKKGRTAWHHRAALSEPDWYY
jgi:hypothetical protein